MRDGGDFCILNLWMKGEAILLDKTFARGRAVVGLNAVAILAFCGSGVALAQAMAPAVATKASPPSAILRPSLDVLKQAIAEASPEKWKASAEVRSEAETNLRSIQRDVEATLLPLLAAADAAPGSPGKVLPVYRNVTALYDVVLRVDAVARAGAPGAQSSALDQALASLNDSQRALGDQLQQGADAQEVRVGRLEAALKAVPPPAPPQAPPAPVACTPPPVKKKAKVAAKPVAPAAGTQGSSAASAH
jgi:hypothetical protein